MTESQILYKNGETIGSNMLKVLMVDKGHCCMEPTVINYGKASDNAVFFVCV